MGKWLRVDALHRQHPKFIAAGFWGGVLVRAAWEIAKAFDCPGGCITQYWTPAYLRRWVGADTDYVEAMQAAEGAGLVDRQGPDIVIHDWNELQPLTSSERVRKHRETVSSVTRNARNVSRVTRDVSRVTRNVGTTHGTNGTNGTDKTNSAARDPSTTDNTPADEAQQLEQKRRTVPCLTCGDPWRRIAGKDDRGDFYGHGREGGRQGCAATCPVDLYTERKEHGERKAAAEHDAAQPRCTGCSGPAVPDGEYCAACKAILESNP